MRYINREQLYKQVWGEPLTRLSSRYKLSAYDLKKLCDKFLIPLPKVGHWSKIAYGKKVETPPLTIFCTCRLKAKKTNVPIVDNIDKMIEKKAPPRVKVNKTLSTPHPLAVKTRVALKKSKKDEYGMKKPWEKSFDVRVSKGNEQRVLRIIDALCKWFDKNDITILQPFDNGVATYVVIDNQRIQIAIEEKSKLTGKKLDDRWGGSYQYYIREYTPTEQLSLVIKNYCWDCSIRKAWRDGKTSKVEEKLDEFVAALFQYAECEKARELRLETERIERERQYKLKRYNEACEKLEKEMLEDLKQQNRNAMYSRELSHYIDEVKIIAKKQYAEDEYPAELINWIHWAENYANELNPLGKGLPSYREATEIIKLEDMEDNRF